MRTKTLVLTAVLGLAGGIAAMAQSVYSLNAVGYVNTVIPKGFSIIANPLNASTNKLSSLITGAPDGTVVYTYANSAFQTIANYSPDDNGNLYWDNDPTIVPGDGFYIYNPSDEFTNTFVGEVETGALSNPITVGFNIKASIVPQAGQLDTDLGYTPSDGDVVYLLRKGVFSICNYAPDDNGNLYWDNIPNVNVGEGFWLFTPTAKTWQRNFTLN
jgi:hypothetical protein